MNPKQISATYAYILVEELIRLGITQCCMAPGARSSALSIAMQAHVPMSSHIFADERSAAFAALGMAKIKSTSNAPWPYFDHLWNSSS